MLSTAVSSKDYSQENFSQELKPNKISRISSDNLNSSSAINKTTTKNEFMLLAPATNTPKHFKNRKFFTPHSPSDTSKSVLLFPSSSPSIPTSSTRKKEKSVSNHQLNHNVQDIETTSVAATSSSFSVAQQHLLQEHYQQKQLYREEVVEGTSNLGSDFLDEDEFQEIMQRLDQSISVFPDLFDKKDEHEMEPLQQEGVKNEEFNQISEELQAVGYLEDVHFNYHEKQQHYNNHQDTTEDQEELVELDASRLELLTLDDGPENQYESNMNNTNKNFESNYHMTNENNPFLDGQYASSNDHHQNESLDAEIPVNESFGMSKLDGLTNAEISDLDAFMMEKSDLIIANPDDDVGSASSEQNDEQQEKHYHYSISNNPILYQPIDVQMEDHALTDDVTIEPFDLRYQQEFYGSDIQDGHETSYVVEQVDTEPNDAQFKNRLELVKDYEQENLYQSQDPHYQEFPLPQTIQQQPEQYEEDIEEPDNECKNDSQVHEGLEREDDDAGYLLDPNHLYQALLDSERQHERLTSSYEELLRHAAMLEEKLDQMQDEKEKQVDSLAREYKVNLEKLRRELIAVSKSPTASTDFLEANSREKDDLIQQLQKKNQVLEEQLSKERQNQEQIGSIRIHLEREKELEMLTLKRDMLMQKENELLALKKEFVCAHEQQQRLFEQEKKAMLLETQKLEESLLISKQNQQNSRNSVNRKQEDVVTQTVSIAINTEKKGDLSNAMNSNVKKPKVSTIDMDVQTEIKVEDLLKQSLALTKYERHLCKVFEILEDDMPIDADDKSQVLCQKVENTWRSIKSSAAEKQSRILELECTVQELNRFVEELKLKENVLKEELSSVKKEYHTERDLKEKQHQAHICQLQHDLDKKLEEMQFIKIEGPFELRIKYPQVYKQIEEMFQAEHLEDITRLKAQLEMEKQDLKEQCKLDVERIAQSLRQQCADAYDSAISKIKEEYLKVMEANKSNWEKEKQDSSRKLQEALEKNKSIDSQIESIPKIEDIESEVHCLRLQLSQHQKQLELVQQKTKQQSEQEYTVILENMKAKYIATLKNMRDDVVASKKRSLQRLETEWARRKAKLDREWSDKLHNIRIEYLNHQSNGPLTAEL